MTFSEAMRKCSQVCAKYESQLGYSDGEMLYELSNELINMAFLLGISDGYISATELNIINRTFNVMLDYNLLAKSYGLDSTSESSFLQRVPRSILEISRAEKSTYMNGKCFLSDTRMIYNAFKIFGNIMITSGGGSALKFTGMLHKHFLNLCLEYIFAVEDRDDLEAYLDGGNAAPRRNDERFMPKPKPGPYAVMPDSRGASFSGPYDEDVKDTGIEENTPQTRERIRLKNDYDRSAIHEVDREKSGESGISRILEEVDQLIGLGGVKKEVHDMVNLLIIQNMRTRSGLKTPAISRHLVFTGNPGTGKTTVARYIARIYKELGILEKGHMIETDRAGLVSGYMGQTAEKVSQVCEKAMGGVLFIDEAYTLAKDSHEADFGQEAIETLLKIMEDKRDSFVVIVAGYTNEMEHFLDSNPGLRSRFSKYIEFEDYSTEDLLKIFKQYCGEKDYTLAEGTDEKICRRIDQLREEGGEAFGNARSIRNYFEEAISNQANRLIRTSGMGGAVDRTELMTIREEDL